MNAGKATKIALIGALCFLVIGCASQPNPQPSVQSACKDADAAKLLTGVEAYNRGLTTVAFENLRAAAGCGNSDAQVNLGYMYARGEGTPVDQQEALRLYQLSAAQGNAEGMNALGYKYQFGTGVPIDMAKAIYWYCKSVARGNPRAMNNLGLDYEAGTGVAPDLATARDLWQQSAERGHTNAKFNLGRSYLGSSDGLEQEKGMKLVIEAATQGSEAAQELLRRLGHQEEMPPPINLLRIMQVQPAKPLPGRTPASCSNRTSN